MKPGRPATPRLTRDAILTEALALLDQSETALTIRALAQRLNVTPMAIQHHIGTRDGDTPDRPRPSFDAKYSEWQA